MSAGMPEMGTKMSLISMADIRYEGHLFTFDQQQNTFALASVRSFGTEDRETSHPVPPQNQVYDYILFRGSDIKTIRIINDPAPVPNDPAIMQLSVPPSSMGPPGQFKTAPGPGFGHPMMGQFNMGGYNIEGGPNMGGMMRVPAGAVHMGSAPGMPPPGGLVPQGKEIGDLPVQENDNIMKNNSGNVIGRKTPNSEVAQVGGQGSNKGDDIVQKVQQGPRGKKDSKDHKENKPIQQQQQQQQQHRQPHNPQQQQQYNNRNNAWQQRPNNRQGNQHQQQQRHLSGNNPGSNRGGNRGNMRGGNRPAPGSFGPVNLNNRNSGNFQKPKIKFEGDYDFEQANSEFMELCEKLAKAKVEDGTEDVASSTAASTTTTSTNSTTAANVTSVPVDKKEDSGNETGTGGETEVEADGDEANREVFYDKSKSFFDNISCEAAERAKGGRGQRTDWRAERKLNTETFGVASSRRGGYHRGRGGFRNNYRSGFRNNQQRQNNQRQSRDAPLCVPLPIATQEAAVAN